MHDVCIEGIGCVCISEHRLRFYFLHDVCSGCLCVSAHRLRFNIIATLLREYRQRAGARLYLQKKGENEFYCAWVGEREEWMGGGRRD